MQTVSNAFTAEERDSIRSISHNLQVSWKKFSTLGNRTFTIGVSTIGGTDVVGINPGAIGSPSNYKYFDESDYVTSLGWDRGLSMPIGGLAKSFGEAELDNTSGRFTPRHMGGSSELFTAIIPGRPAIINAGFEFDGIENTIPQFTGRVNRQPEVDRRRASVRLSMDDYIGYFENKELDRVAMYTGVTTDVLLENIFTQLGMSTAQYDLDPGINVIPFALLEAGAKYSDVISKLVQAENGHLYQDELGIFKFENRQHWDSAPFNQVQRIITTAQVISQNITNEDHIINSVEVVSNYRAKQPLQPIMNYSSDEPIATGESKELFFSYDDPILQVITPTVGGADSYYQANTVPDESGTDISSSIAVISVSHFAQASKIVVKNNYAGTAYITKMVISGRPARQVGDIKYREKDDSSVTAYDERLLQINNDYIASPSWAQSFAKMVLRDFSNVENLQKITIRAIPELQLGDLVSWQGRYWRVFDIKAQLDPSVGFIQELTMLQRTVESYFRIGISTIGGSDKIAP